MTFKTTPIEYLGKKARYLHLFDELIEGRVESFCDLTGGSGTVPLFMVEQRGTRDLIFNDISLFPRMIADAFFVRPPMSQREISRNVVVLPEPGFLCETKEETRQWRAITDESAAWVDAFCVLNSERPLLLLSLACVLLHGAARFCEPVAKWLGRLTPASLADETLKRASSLRLRQHGGRLAVTVTSENYLDPPPADWDLDGRVIYLDPAWPTQPGHKTLDNTRCYGLYASLAMSIVRQEPVPVPAIYKVKEDDFYSGMRAAIESCLVRGARMLVAYQTTEARIDEVIAEIFPDREVSMTSADKNASSTLREYLFEVLP